MGLRAGRKCKTKILTEHRSKPLQPLQEAGGAVCGEGDRDTTAPQAGLGAGWRQGEAGPRRAGWRRPGGGPGPSPWQRRGGGGTATATTRRSPDPRPPVTWYDLHRRHLEAVSEGEDFLNFLLLGFSLNYPKTCPWRCRRERRAAQEQQPAGRVRGAAACGWALDQRVEPSPCAEPPPGSSPAAARCLFLLLFFFLRLLFFLLLLLLPPTRTCALPRGDRAGLGGTSGGKEGKGQPLFALPVPPRGLGSEPQVMGWGCCLSHRPIPSPWGRGPALLGVGIGVPRWPSLYNRAAVCVKPALNGERIT